MLAQLFRYWTTFAPERVRKFGYLKQLIGLEFLYKRNEHAWDDHVMSCREFIVDAINKCPNHGTAVVLGSGLLLEVPLRSLADPCALWRTGSIAFIWLTCSTCLKFAWKQKSTST